MPEHRRRAFLILNPFARRGKGRGLERRLAEAARALDWEVEVATTRRPGHEIELAAGARQGGWPLVVAVGGDGTAHGVANGLLADGPTDVVLGHIPVGNGNDFAKIVGLTSGPVEVNLGRLDRGVERRLDVGCALGEYFVNGMGIGFDAEVVRHTFGLRRVVSGFPLYLTAVYKAFWSFTAPELSVVAAEHTERGRLMMLEISIGTTAGGSFRLTPDALPDDGLFDVCIIREVGLVDFLRYVPKVVRGTHGGLPEVTHFRTGRVSVTGTTSAPTVHLDGELRRPDERHLEVNIVPHALRVLCAS